MKKFVLAGAAAAVLVSAPAMAQQARGEFDRAQGITRGEVETRVRQVFARVDTNRDGFVTQAEAQAARQAFRANRQEQRQERREARFARLDTNRDGSISRAEFSARQERADRGERRGQQGGFAARLGGGRMFERLDTNRDGRVSLGEATSARLAAFDRADANRDGRVTREERRALRSERQGRG